MRDVVFTYSVAIEPDHTTVQGTLLSVITVYEPSCKGDNGYNSLRLLTRILCIETTQVMNCTQEQFITEGQH